MQEFQRFQGVFEFLTIFLNFTKICFCDPLVWTWGMQALGVEIRVTEKEKENKVFQLYHQELNGEKGAPTWGRNCFS